MNEPKTLKSKTGDVTKHKDALKRLKKSEQQYRALIQTIPDITYELDPDGKFVFVSDAIKQLGYKPKELIGKHFGEIIHPDDLKAVSRSLVLPKYKGKRTGDARSPKLFDERRTGGRMTSDLEVRLMVKSKKGTSKNYRHARVYSTIRLGGLENQERVSKDDRYIEVHSSGKWGADGKMKNSKLLGSIGIIRDVTERRRMEKVLAKEHNLFRTLIDNMPDFIYAKDTESRFVLGNIAVTRLMGARTPDELLGKTDFAFYPQELAKKFYADEQKVMRSGKPLVDREEPLMDLATGGRGWLSTTKVPLRDSSGKVVGVVGISREITERKHMEGEIKKAQERLSGIYSCSKDAIGYANLDGVLLDVNDSFAKLTGYSKEELLAGKKYQDLTPGEYQQYEAKIVEKLLKTGKAQEYEKEYIRKDGSRVPILLTAFVVKGLKGKPIGVAAIIKDVTERRRAYEEEKQLVAARAAAEVEKKRAVELSRAYKGLKETEDKLVRSERLAALGKLAGALGHELRNLLSVIGNSAYFLRRKLGKMAEDEKIKKHLDILDGEIKISDRIISDIMEFGRAREPQLAKTNINGIIRSCLEKVEMPENIEVVTELGNNVPQVLADETQLKQVFSNIIVNAVQAMPEGGKLTITGINKDKFIEASITDTGEGIEKEILDKIFEALFSTKEQGTGLGLTVCQSIVERHNGSIEVESEVGKGTKFSIKLPVTNKED